MFKKVFLIAISFLILCAIKDGSLFIFAQQKGANNKEKGIIPVDYTGAQYRDPLELPMELRTPIKPVVETAAQPTLKIEREIEREIVLPTFTIQGIVWGGVKPQALINQGLCEKGDIIKGAKIADITKEGVTFVYKNKKFIIQPTIKLQKIGQIKEE